MGVYKLSKLAATDLADIYEYGILRFGLNQSKKYLLELEISLQGLAENANLGRSAYDLSPQLRRFAFQSHLIFYLPTNSGIFIVRILSHSMDFEQHL